MMLSLTEQDGLCDTMIVSGARPERHVEQMRDGTSERADGRHKTQSLFDPFV